MIQYIPNEIILFDSKTGVTVNKKGTVKPLIVFKEGYKLILEDKRFIAN